MFLFQKRRLSELQCSETEIVAAAGCCVCLSCWHPLDIFNKEPYPTLYLDYGSEDQCIKGCGVLEHTCGHEWHQNKKCNNVKGQIEEL